ncbi:MAG: NAD-dependent epimerase [Lautropia sp.]
MTVLVTGAAGFIGMHTALRLLAKGERVVGIDNLNDYYSPELKAARLAKLDGQPGFSFHKLDVSDQTAMRDLFAGQRFDSVVHLAAQAGVRHSLENPHAYVESNLAGFVNILEGCRHSKVGHLVYASSSSVYGGNTRMPLSEHHLVDHPISLYAVTKKSNELMAHAYSHLFGIPTTGLRFFTVYGPWGRPDMALFLFTDAILNDRPIRLFNEGRMRRDFTYVDDIVESLCRVLDKPPQPSVVDERAEPDPATSWAPYRVFNIGNSAPVDLGEFVAAIEAATGRTARREYWPMQPGDVPATYADTSELEALTGFRPSTPIGEGVERFVRWYQSYYSGTPQQAAR